MPMNLESHADDAPVDVLMPQLQVSVFSVSPWFIIREGCEVRGT